MLPLQTASTQDSFSQSDICLSDCPLKDSKTSDTLYLLLD